MANNDKDPYWRSLVEDWAWFSGDFGFPVPGPAAVYNPARAYQTLPRWEGAYGERRRELLAHIHLQLSLDYRIWKLLRRPRAQRVKEMRDARLTCRLLYWERRAVGWRGLERLWAQFYDHCARWKPR